MKLVLCKSSGNGDRTKMTVPEVGVVYRVVQIVTDHLIYLPTGSRVWYKLDKTGPYLHVPELFEDLPEDITTNINEHIKIEKPILS